MDVSLPDFPQRLAQSRANLVIHAAGPFQAQDYRVAEAAIAAGCDYIDLADARAFVTGFGRLDAAARLAGVTAITGASTVPAVSSAVVDALARSLHRLDEVHVVIAPGQRTPRGDATMAAVLSYCGRPFDVRKGGKLRVAHGWQRVRLAAYWQLGRRLSADCDVPDLALFPERWPTLQTVTFQASLELAPSHVALWLLAVVARAGLIRNWSQFAKRINTLSSHFDRFGSDVGGMRVRVKGMDVCGKLNAATWSLIARNGHGPEIPCMPAVIIAKRLCAGTRGEPGARSAMGEIALEEFEVAARAFDIQTQTVVEAA